MTFRGTFLDKRAPSNLFTLMVPICGLASSIVLSGCQEPFDGKAIESRLEKLENDERLNLSTRLRSTFYDSVILNVNDEGFSVIQADISRLTFQLKSLAPSGSGSKASLQIGNPSSANIIEMKAKLEWGPTDKDGLAIADGARTAERTLAEFVPAGRWTTIEIPLADVTPQKLGHLTISNVRISRITMIE